MTESKKIYERIIAAMLAFLLAFLCCGDFRPYAADTAGNLIEVTAVVVKKDGKEIDPATDTLKEGDEIKIEYEWKIANINSLFSDDSDNSEQIVVVTLENLNMKGSTGWNTNTWQDGHTLSKWVKVQYIIDPEENKIYFKFTKKEGADREDNIEGSGDITCVVSPDKANGDFIGQATITIGDQVVDPITTENLRESSISAQKSSKGSIYYDAGSGKYMQKFEIALKANDGYVTDIKLSDVLGSNLENAAITGAYEWVNNQQVPFDGYSGSLGSELTIERMEMNQTVYIEYTTEVKNISTAANAQYDDTTGKNEIKVTYQNNNSKDPTPEETESSANISYSKPTADKTGAINGNKVNWTITLKPGSLGANIENLITGIKDTLSSNTEYKGDLKLDNLTIDNFTQVDGNYVLNYETELGDDVMNSPTSVNIINKFDVTFKDNLPPISETETVVKYPEKHMLSKSGQDNGDGTMTWTVNAKVEGGITSFKIKDSTEYYYEDGCERHYMLLDTISVNGKPLQEVDGVSLTNDWQISDENGVYGATLKFEDPFVNAHRGETISIQYTTKSVKQDDFAGKYRNYAELTYWLEGDSNTPHTEEKPAKAEVEIISGKGSSHKKCTNEYDNNTQKVEWRINLDKELVKNMNNDSIVITDTLPDELVYDGSFAPVLQIWDDYNPQNGHNAYGNVSAAVDGQEIIFTITGIDDIKAGIEAAEGKGLYVGITYKTIIDLSKLKEGDNKLTNTANVSIDNNKFNVAGTVNKNKGSVTESVASKKIDGDAKQDKTSYIIEVNKYRYDLDMKSDTVKLTDTFGEKLYLLPGSPLPVKIEKVEEANDSNGWQARIVDITAECAISYDSNTKTITMEVPDEEYLKIEYSVAVDMPEGKVSEADKNKVSNTFEVGSGLKTAANYIATVQKASVLVLGTQRGVELTKTDSADLTKFLPGAKFSVKEALLSKGAYEFGEFVDSGVSATSNNKGVVNIEGLLSDRLYCIYESQAPEGYTLTGSKTIYMFFKGNDYKAEPDRFLAAITKFEEDNNCDVILRDNGVGSFSGVYSNKKQDIPEFPLNITKKVVGGNAADRAAEFTVNVTVTAPNGGTFRLSNGEEITSGVLKAITIKDGETITINGLPQGTTYKVVEVGENLKEFDVSYTNESGKIENAAVTATVTNTRKVEMRSLKVTKTVGGTDGDTNKEFTFTVDIEGGSYKGVITNNGTEVGKVEISATNKTVKLKHGDVLTITGIPTGTKYVITEDSEDYTSTDSGNTKGTINGNTAVEFTNTLSIPRTLTVTKTVGGTDGDQNKLFDFTVNIGGTGPYTGVIGGEKINIPANEDTTVQLKHGDTLVIENIPTGTPYTVSEDKQNYVQEIVGDAEGKITENTEVVFTNTLNIPRSDLEITKTVTGGFGERNRYFEFVVNIDADGEFAVTGGNIPAGRKIKGKANEIILLKHGDKVTISGIPVGANYTITEKVPEGYDKVDPKSGTISANTANKADFVNNRDGVPPTGVVLDILPFVAMAAIAGAAIAILIVTSRKRRNKDSKPW